VAYSALQLDAVCGCRKRKMEMEQQMLAWRVLYEDIEFMGSASSASAAGSSSVRPPVSAYYINLCGLDFLFKLCHL